MKIISIIILGLFLGSGFVFSQCFPVVSSSSESIKGPPFQRTKSNSHFWVCRGQTLSLNGSNNTVYVEDSAAVNVQGDSNTIYQQAYGTLTISGTQNFVSIDPNSTFTDNASFTTKTPCPGMVFDYSSSPAGGCDFAAGIAINTQEQIVSIFPVPASDVLYLHLNREPKNSRLSIFSLDGKRLSNVMIKQSRIELDVSFLNPGLYFIEVQMDEERYVEKILIK